MGVAGLQAEIDASKDVGGLYETAGRGWVFQPKPAEMKSYFHPGEWNTMTVSAHGHRIVVHVNGAKSSELRDDPGRLEGQLALQADPVVGRVGQKLRGIVIVANALLGGMKIASRALT